MEYKDIVPYRLVESLDEIKIDPAAYLYHDVETTKLGSGIRLVQLFQTHWPEVLIIDIQKFDLMDVYQLIKSYEQVWHNGLYERTCYRRDLGSFADFENRNDTFLAGRLALPHLERFNLEDMLETVHRKNYYESQGLDKKKMQKSNWGGKLTDTQYRYAAADVYYLPKLWSISLKFKDEMSYKLDDLAQTTMLIFQDCGFPINLDKLNDFRLDCEAKIKEEAKKLPKGFNVKSWRQVRSLLNVDSSDDEALAYVVGSSKDEQQVARAESIRLIRKLRKRLEFVVRYENNAEYNGRLYGFFNVATKSGRSNSSDENLQQIPSSMKHLFETDKYFVYADFSNLELRTFAAIVGERVMVEKFFNDEDLHTYSASKLFNVPVEEVTKRQRTIAKIWNFASLYGAGVNTRLQILLKLTGIVLTEVEGKTLASAWLKTYPGVKPWQEQNAAKWRAGQAGYTALGRRYIAKLFTDQNNIQVQGSGAEVAKLTLWYLHKEIDISKLCVFVHDSYTFECDTLEEAKHYAKVLAEKMNEAWREVSKNFVVKDLPMPVDAVVGKNWYKCQEDEELIYKYSISSKGERSEQTY